MNKQIETFKRRLHERGYSLLCLWQARIDPDSEFPELNCYAVQPNREGVPDPKHPHIVIRDMGRNGFALFSIDTSPSIDDSVIAVIR